MDRAVAQRRVWQVGGALLIGAALAGIYRLLSFEVDFDPWDDAYLY